MLRDATPTVDESVTTAKDIHRNRLLLAGITDFENNDSFDYTTGTAALLRSKPLIFTDNALKAYVLDVFSSARPGNFIRSFACPIPET